MSHHLLVPTIMKLHFVYGFLPALVFYTDKLDPRHGGTAQGPVVKIRTKYRGTDEGILRHELTHVKQWYRTLFIHPLLYLFVPEYKLAAEVEAYRVQARYYSDDRRPRFARYIAESYGLEISQAKALELLRE